MAVTVRDVAKKAGVALGTVSRYLNGAQLREENRLKVEQAIEELGFKEQVSVIAVILEDISGQFYTSIIRAIEHYLNRKKYNLIICDFENDLNILQDRLQFFKNRAVDGFIFFPPPFSADCLETLEEYIDARTPFVLVDSLIPGLDTDSVLVDNADASFRLVEHLIHNNHHDIAILNGRQGDDYVSRERFRGYCEALQTYGIERKEQWVKYGDFTTLGGNAAVKELFQSSERPSAIYSTNYEMTLGAAFALNELQIKVPEDLSFVGFDHFFSTDLINPPLTVIEQPVEEIGKSVGRLLMKRIQEDYTDYPQTIKLKTRMLLRNSVKKLESP